MRKLCAPGRAAAAAAAAAVVAGTCCRVLLAGGDAAAEPVVSERVPHILTPPSRPVQWIHVGSFGMSSEAQRAKWGDCVDADERCEEWAAVGECEVSWVFT